MIRPHLEYASAAWDPYTARDSHQLDKVQGRAARFAKRDYRQTTSVSELICELRWQSLEDRRKNARLSLFYKGLHGLAAIHVHLLLCHLASMPINSRFSQGQWQIGTLFLPPLEPKSLLILSRKPSTNSQTILLIIAEPCHSSSTVTGDHPSLDTHWRTEEHGQSRTQPWTKIDTNAVERSLCFLLLNIVHHLS